MLDQLYRGPRQFFFDRLADLRSQPTAWLISTIVHVALFLLLALIPVVSQLQQGLVLQLGGDAGEGDTDGIEFDISGSANLGLSDADALDVVPIPSPTAMDLTQGLTIETPIINAPSLGAVEMGFQGRSGNLKGALLRAYGGTQATEDAVQMGLEWLMRRQTVGGSWALAGNFANPSDYQCRVGATAMALIAFAGAGHTHISGDFQPVVEKGVLALLTMQNDSGIFFRDDAPSNFASYAHAQATIALCELYGMTQDSRLRQPCERALQAAMQWQDRSGGWRYEPAVGADLSVTGWFLMALVSGRTAGFDIDPGVLDRAGDYVKTTSLEGGRRFSYMASSQWGTDAMSAEGLLCQLYLGKSKTSPEILEGAAILNESPVTVEVNDRDYYYWYYASQLMHHLGGQPWQKWNDVMKVELPAMQQKDGVDRGSWPPRGDHHAERAGRLYSTAMSIFCLEVYYRHMPLYSDKAVGK